MAVFIFDIDGTLCKDSSVLAKEDLKVLNNLKTKGHKILFATGRGLEAVKDALHHNKNLLNTLIACENGSKIFSNNGLISTSKFSKEEIKLILNLIHTNKAEIECIDFWGNSKLYTYKTPSFVTPVIEDKYRVKIDFIEMTKSIEGRELTMLNINFKLRPSLKTYSLNLLIGSNSVQILPLNISKAKLYDSIDLSSEIYLFGDSDNDLELFKNGKKLNKVIYLVGENPNLKPYTTANLKGITEVFAYLQSNF